MEGSVGWVMYGGVSRMLGDVRGSDISCIGRGCVVYRLVSLLVRVACKFANLFWKTCHGSV